MSNIPALFSLDFVWSALGEFGITGIPAYYAVKIFPTFESFKYGSNLLMSILFVLPIGWMGFNYIFSTTLLNNKIHELGVYTHTGLGGSIIVELFIDFGWLSLLFSIIIGYFLCKIIYVEKESISGHYSFKEVLSLCLIGEVINLVRGSSTEFFRNAGLFFIIFILFLFVFKPKTMSELMIKRM